MLSPHISAAEEQLVILVEALTAHNLEQHILVRNPFLAKRLAVCGGVSVGPIVRSIAGRDKHSRAENGFAGC